MDDGDTTQQLSSVNSEQDAVDLMGSSSQRALRDAQRRRRRPWAWMAATALASLVAAVAVASAASNHASARDWQDAAGGWQQRAADLEAERDDIAAERADVVGELRAAEQALAETEDRVADITAERETARDQAALRADDLDLAATIGVDLSSCVDGLFDWLSVSPPYDAGAAAWDAYFAAGDDIAAVCGQARGDFAAFTQALESLNR